MEIVREQEFVNQYHYNARNYEWEKENGTPETKVEVKFQLNNKDEEKQVTSIVSILKFMIVRDEFVINGFMSLLNHVQGRIINEPSELSQEEVESLAAPLLDTLKRMTYEVTEIALDRQGITLEF